jgi:2,4-dienoyl-CoA reductase-like NADH-dependent reductase (Old Yellow Enzyme family)/thioredoxin reductase
MPITDFKNLLSPLSINLPNGELVLRNRVLVSAHVPGFADNHKPGQDYINYHQRYAEEGVGLQITGGTPVHKSGLLSLRPDALWNLDDSIIPGYLKLARAVHANGGRMLAQLAHSGGTVQIVEPGVTTWSASAVRSSITGHVSHAMSVAEITEVVQAFADAAARVREGGLDGVEVLGAFGFLPQAFLSPLTNFREDQYGGSLENRMRFLIELLQAVRPQLGPQQVLGVRLPGDEFEPGGLTLDDMKIVCKLLSDKRLVDYISIIAHTNVSHTGRSKHWPPTPAPHGLFTDLAAAIKAEVAVPVFTVGRIVDPAHADRIVARNQADMVGMTRAHICDPTIVSKIKMGSPGQVRPCVGANTCIANRYAGKTIRCMHNPELKSPGKVLMPAKVKQNISVIGAGPAGLEAARLCALRGHQVEIFEKTQKLGGQLAYWAKVKSMHELGRIIQWRESELERLGVEITLGSNVDVAAIQELEADQVIIATGAVDKPGRFKSTSSTRVVTPIEMLDEPAFGASSALIIADGRGQAALVCAERLLDAGASVEIVTEDVAVAHDVDPTNRNAWYERLGKRGVKFKAQTVVTEITFNKILLRNIYSDEISERSGIDLLVDWNGCDSDNSLVQKSQAVAIEGAPKVHAIGDCLAPRSVEIAMAEALQLAEIL